MNTAHIVVDMLYDFIDGTLACRNAENAVQKSIGYINLHKDQKVIYIADSHPANHCSFKEFGGIWPAHCVKSTKGGEIHKKFFSIVENIHSRPSDENILKKGEDPLQEQYSGFEAKSYEGVTLFDYLKNLNINSVVISGIATEYCVKQTALDLLKAGFNISLLTEGLGYITEEGHAETIDVLKQLGVILE